MECGLPVSSSRVHMGAAEGCRAASAASGSASPGERGKGLQPHPNYQGSEIPLPYLHVQPST